MDWMRVQQSGQACKTNDLYSGDLKSGHQKVVGLKRIRISNGIWDPEATPFEIRTNGCHFVKNNLKNGQKCPDFEWPGFLMVATLAIDMHQTIWNQIFKKSRLWMDELQIPAVVEWYLLRVAFEYRTKNGRYRSGNQIIWPITTSNIWLLDIVKLRLSNVIGSRL